MQDNEIISLFEIRDEHANRSIERQVSSLLL